MKTLGTLLLASMSMASLGFAQDCPAQGKCPLGPPASAAPAQEVSQDDDDEKSFQEVETLLNEVLLVDEQGQFKLRKEFRDSLPIPAERVEGMLGAFVFLDDNGKIKIQDREAIRPYLPMIKGFLGPGLKRIKELEKLPPEERKKAMQELMDRAQRGELEPPAEEKPAEKKPVEKPSARKEPPVRERPREDRTRREDPPRRTRRERFRAPRNEGSSIEERLDRIERALARIERGMRDGHREGAEGRREGNRRGLLQRLFGDRGRDRGLYRRERRGLGDLFRGRRDRDRGRDSEGLRGMFRTGRTWSQGLRKLFEIMEPEDFNSVGEGLRALTQDGFDPGSLTDPSKALEKLQTSLPAEDAARFMEIFSEFIGSDEGRAFADQIDKSAQRLESFVNSEEGRNIAERVRELQKQLGAGSSELQDKIEELIQGRSRRNRDRADRTPHDEREQRSSRRNHDRNPEPRTAPPSGKLY